MSVFLLSPIYTWMMSFPISYASIFLPLRLVLFKVPLSKYSKVAFVLLVRFILVKSSKSIVITVNHGTNLLPNAMDVTRTGDWKLANQIGNELVCMIFILSVYFFWNLLWLVIITYTGVSKTNQGIEKEDKKEGMKNI